MIFLVSSVRPTSRGSLVDSICHPTLYMDMWVEIGVHLFATTWLVDDLLSLEHLLRRHVSLNPGVLLRLGRLWRGVAHSLLVLLLRLSQVTLLQKLLALLQCIRLPLGRNVGARGSENRFLGVISETLSPSYVFTVVRYFQMGFITADDVAANTSKIPGYPLQYRYRLSSHCSSSHWHLFACYQAPYGNYSPLFEWRNESEEWVLAFTYLMSGSLSFKTSAFGYRTDL